MRARQKDLPQCKAMSTTLKQLIPYIEASHYPLTYIAKRAGVSTYTIYRWLRGEAEPNITHLESIAQVVYVKITVEPDI